MRLRSISFWQGMVCVALLGPPGAPATAALLRPFNQITGPMVHLADLFEDLGATPDRVLGQAPEPGGRIVVKAPQLAAIARDFAVDWRPATGSEQTVLERRGDVLPREAVLATLRGALQAAGAPEDIEIEAPDLQDMLVPTGTLMQPRITQLSYDPERARFSAVLVLPRPDMPALQARLSGTVVAMVQAAIAQRRLTFGSVVGADDVRQVRVRAPLLHGAAALLPAAAIGQTMRHTLAAGQPLAVGDVARTPLVVTGDHVRMVLVSDSLALTAQGIAAGTGGRGDRIRVENPVSHRMVDAEITGADVVRVSPRAASVDLAAAQ